MKVTFADTETTGLPLFKLPSEDPKQPRIVQIAASMHNDQRQVIGHVSSIIRPDGWEIPKEASDIHGITTEIALREGKDPVEVLTFAADILMDSDMIVGHNISFDMRMIRIDMMRYKILDEHHLEALSKKSTFCTMNEAKSRCKLPPTDRMMAAGIRGYKAPTLQEAYKHFTGNDLIDAHDAAIDMGACETIYYHLKKAA